MSNILSNIGKFSEDENSTIEAIRDYFRETKNEFKPTQKVAFSSKTKWSGIYFEDEGSYIIGAPEFVLRDKFDKYKNMIEKYAKDYRVIVLANSKENFIKNELPDNVELIGFVLILDKIRKEAKNTLEYFERQGVDVKIISGDNPITVSKIAKQVGIKEYNNYIDMSTLKSDKEVKEAALKYTIFGRVSPTQKKALVLALQEKEKTVAMTGDGVNDVLALKASDCSIAMANGIYIEIKKRILDAEEGSIFVTSDFTDIATTTTVRKCLGRQVEEKNIRRIIDGVYEKPVYSNLLREYVPANPEKVAYAIARGFHWTIAPCGDVALNKLGLSTQVPVVWSYISDGPYRKFSWDNITLSFRHRANREISFMSETTTLVVEALKTLGKDRVDDGIILSLRNRLPKEEKKKMLEEATGVSE